MLISTLNGLSNGNKKKYIHTGKKFINESDKMKYGEKLFSDVAFATQHLT